jgi:hypothetical protein
MSGIRVIVPGMILKHTNGSGSIFPETNSSGTICTGINHKVRIFSD